jgi:hypothetical protein
MPLPSWRTFPLVGAAVDAAADAEAAVAVLNMLMFDAFLNTNVKLYDANFYSLIKRKYGDERTDGEKEGRAKRRKDFRRNKRAAEIIMPIVIVGAV